MKNLKKVLALVLAFACAFTMFAGAAFTDAADIEQTQAVDMLSALGVINGYTDGSFKPNETISRAEAAKMIYTIRNGGNDDATAFEGASVFTDVYSGHWAEGYINFCYTNGIINGKGNGKFAPDDKVTGTELAKMLLICMGYQADKSGLTGTGYTQRTNALASQNGLYDGVSASVTAAMPRQHAAQIMYNALQADTVTWSTDSNSYQKTEVTTLETRPVGNGNVQWVNVTKNETMGKKWMGLDSVEGSANTNVLTSVKKEAGRDTYTLEVGVLGGGTTTYTRVATDYSDLVGRDVVVMLKNNDTSKVYGIYAKEDSTVVASGFVGGLKDVTETKKTELNGTSISLAADPSVIDVYQVNNDTATVKLNTLEGSKNNTAYAAAELSLIDNDGDGKVETVVYKPQTVHQVTYVGNTSFTLKGLNTIKLEDSVVYEGMAKDDWAIYTPGTNTVSGDPEVVKADTISGEINGTKSSNGVLSARIDDTWYDLANSFNSNLTNGSTYDLVVVGTVIFNAEETQGSSQDILMISDVNNTPETGFSNSGATQQAMAYFLDGSSKSIVVEKLNNTTDGTDPAKIVKDDNQLNSANDIGKLYTFSVNSTGNYELELLNNTNNKAGYDYVRDYAAGEAVSGNLIGGNSVADDAVVFVKYMGGDNNTEIKVKVITGSVINGWDSNYKYGTDYVAASKESNGINYVQVAAITAPALYSGAGSDYQYGYLTSNPYDTTKNPDGTTDKVTAFEIWNGTENVTVYTDGTKSTQLVAGDVLVYTTDGKYVDVHNANRTMPSGLTMEEVAITGFDYKAEGNVKFNSSTVAGKQYKLDADCVFLAINAKDKTGLGNDMNQISFAQPGTGDYDGKYLTNAYIIYTSENKIVAVIFDADQNDLGNNRYYF